MELQNLCRRSICVLLALADLGGAWGTHAPPWASKFFRFHAVFGKIWRVHAPPGGFTPPPRENPGSATGWEYCFVVWKVSRFTRSIFSFIVILSKKKFQDMFTSYNSIPFIKFAILYAWVNSGGGQSDVQSLYLSSWALLGKLHVTFAFLVSRRILCMIWKLSSIIFQTSSFSFWNTFFTSEYIHCECF